MQKWILALPLILLLTACQAQTGTPQPQEMPAPVRVELAPEISWLNERVNACAQQTGQGILLLPPGQSPDVQLIWGPPPAGSTAISIQAESWAVIVPPTSPLTEIDYARFQAIFSGRQKQWLADTPDSEAIDLWAYSSPGADALLVSLLNSPLRPDASLSSDPAALITAVAANPGAVGILPSAWLDSSVKSLALVNFPPHIVQQPVLAVTATEPQEGLRNWLACLSAP